METTKEETAKPVRIIVTGEREDLEARVPAPFLSSGVRLEWVSLPVLRFERLPVKQDLIDRLIQKPVDWIVFTSSRSVKFWSEVLLESGVDLPVETQVACIGEQTANVASADGYTPDFYPTEPGTEKFLEEFEDLISNVSIKPTVFIPLAEGGRRTIRDRLAQLGCEVTCLSLYRTLPREDVRSFFSQEQLEASDLILFTSPSSVDAFAKWFSIPGHVKVGSLGRFTSEHLRGKGIEHRKLPQGDFRRIGEVLC